MDGVKPWQLAIIILGLLGGFALVAGNIFAGEEIRLADSVILADVRTGALFEISTKGHHGVLLPAKHPETGERTLLPVHETERGQWNIDSRYMADLARFDAQQRAALDAQGRVSPESKDIHRIP
jgi:hypothetical protein